MLYKMDLRLQRELYGITTALGLLSHSLFARLIGHQPGENMARERQVEERSSSNPLDNIISERYF